LPLKETIPFCVREGLALLTAHRAFSLLDQTFGHIAADVACLTGRQIAIVSLLEIDAQLRGDLVFHLVVVFITLLMRLSYLYL